MTFTSLFSKVFIILLIGGITFGAMTVTDNSNKLNIQTDKTNLDINVIGCVFDTCLDVSSRFNSFKTVLTKLDDNNYKFDYDFRIPNAIPDNTEIELRVSINSVSPVNGVFYLGEVNVNFNDILNTSSFLLEDKEGYLRIYGTVSGGDHIILDPLISIQGSTFAGFNAWNRVAVRSPNGTLWVVIPNNTASGSHAVEFAIWHSTNNGTTWTHSPVGWNRTVDGANLDITVIYDEALPMLHMLYTDTDGTDITIHRSFTISTGVLSSAHTVFSGNGQDRVYNQISNGTLYAFRWNLATVTPVYASGDDGVTWVSVNAGTGHEITHGASYTDINDVIHLISGEDADKTWTYYNFSDDTYSTEIVIPNTLGNDQVFPSGIVVNNTGGIYIVGYGKGNSAHSWGIFFAKRNVSGVWNPVQLVANVSGQDLFKPQLFNTTNGIYVVYENGSSNDMYYKIYNTSTDSFTDEIEICQDCDTASFSRILGEYPNSNSQSSIFGRIDIIFRNGTSTASYMSINYTVSPSGVIPQPVTITLTSPTNITYGTTGSSTTIPLTFTVVGNSTSYACWRNINGTTTSLGSINNNTVSTTNIVYTLSTHNASVTCQNIGSNTTSSQVFFSVGLISLSVCDGTNTVIANFSFRQESDRTAMLSNAEVVTDFWTGSNSPSQLLNNHSNVNSFAICVNIAGDILTNTTIQYGNSTIQPQREYYLLNIKLNGTVSYYNLSLLSDADSSTANIFTKNVAGLDFPDQTVSVQKYYFDINEWRTIAMVRTDTDGVGTTNLVDSATSTTQIFYRFIASDNAGVNTTTQGGKLTAEANTGGTITITKVITIGGAVGKVFDIINKVAVTCTNTTDTISCTYADVSGTLTLANMTINQKSHGSNVFTRLCQNTSTANSGTISCTLGATPNGTYAVTFNALLDGTNAVVKTQTFTYLIPAVLGVLGLIITAFMIGTIGFMGKGMGASAMIIFILFGLIISSYMGFFIVAFDVFAFLILSGLLLAVVLRD